MSAYVVALIDIQDPVAYEEYGRKFDFESFSSTYGGEFLMISDDPEVLEGDWKGRLVVMRFPDRDRAKAWHDSAEYGTVRPIRWSSASTSMTIHPEFDLAAALATSR